MRQAMVRKQLYLEARQDKALKRLARERGTTEAEVMRDALDRYTSGPVSVAADEIWRREVEYMRERMKRQQAPQRPRDWTRADLYEERLGRHDRHPG
jgi:hypothetical protein